MEQTLSVREWATIKRVAACVAPMVQKQIIINNKIKELNEEYSLLNTQIAGFEQGIKQLCHGFTTQDLIHREVSTKVNSQGLMVKKISYEPNSCVSYNKEQNNYTLHIKETPGVDQEEIAESIEE